MACHGDFWYRKYGRCRFKATRKDNATNLSLRRVARNRDTGKGAAKTFSTSQLEAGIGWDLKAGISYDLYLTIVRGNSSKKGTAEIELKVRDQALFQGDCSTSGEDISGDWRVIVFRSPS